MNDVSSVKLTNSQKIDAKATVNGKTFTAFPAYEMLSEPEFTVDVVCGEEGYVFSHFVDEKGNVYAKDAVLSGDLNLDMIFAYVNEPPNSGLRRKCLKATLFSSSLSIPSIYLNNHSETAPYE